MLYIHTGRNRLLFDALRRDVEAAEHTRRIVVVPKQLTLLTERMLMEALELCGSFEIQVMGAQRLCDRVFQAAGDPEGIKIDDRGRTILVHAALEQVADQLTIYRGSLRRRGFVQRAAQQLETLRQAGVCPDQLRECAKESQGSAERKLTDLALIQEKYEELLEGRYLDGEEEFAQAGARVGDAAFLRGAHLYFYGFDMMPPSLMTFLVRVSGVCETAHIYMPMENDPDARDTACFRPIRGAVERLRIAAKKEGVDTELKAVEEDDYPQPPYAEGVRVLEKELFAYNPVKATGGADNVHLAEFTDVRGECRYAAATIRDTVRKSGWKYSDFVVLCSDPGAYGPMIRTAFAEYGVPVVLSDRRSASRHSVAECLLATLDAIARNYTEEDMSVLMRTGMTALSEDEADRLTNWAIRNGTRGKRWTEPLKHYRGKNAEKLEKERDAIEPLREKLIAPIKRLANGLKGAKTLTEQLTALYAYMTECGIHGRIDEHMKALTRADLWEEAGEEGQVWNRIVGTLDQLNALMDGRKMEIAELRDVLEESLSMAVIRSLPQSGDAVYVQGVNSVCRQRCRMLMLLGMADHGASDSGGLLTPAQRDQLSRFTDAYLGPVDADLALLNRFSLKCSLGMVSDMVYMSCPLSGAGGEAQKCSILFDNVRELIDGVPFTRSVNLTDDEQRRLLGSVSAAMSGAATYASALGEGGAQRHEAERAALAALAKRARTERTVQAGLNTLRRGLRADRGHDTLSGDVANLLYKGLRTQSISKLEQFAKCPLSYFSRYGLDPKDVEPFVLNAADEGTFMHECAEQFVQRYRDELHMMEPEAARERMGILADAKLEAFAEESALGDTVVTRQEATRLRNILCFTAEIIVNQMHDSRFRNIEVERKIGAGTGEAKLALGSDCVLRGTIDRVDEWEDYIHVIDLKRGAHEFDPTEFYHGLQLQLILYLAGARMVYPKQSAGVHYLKFEDDTVSSDSFDAEAIRKARAEKMQLKGITSENTVVQEALTPDLKKYYGVDPAKIKENTKVATEAQFELLANHGIKRAAEHIAAIRSGVCGAAPVRSEKNPCEYCDMRGSVCMRAKEERSGATKHKTIKYDELMRKLLLESEGAVGE